MTKKSVLLISALSAAAGYAMAEYPDLKAHAGIIKQEPFVHSSKPDYATGVVQSDVEGLCGRAVNHANNLLELSGEAALTMEVNQCPMKGLNFYCTLDDEGARQWYWEYSTKKLDKTSVYALPQE